MAERGPATRRRLAGFTASGYDKGRSVVWQAAWFAVQNLLFASWWLPPRIRPPLLRLFGARIGRDVLIRHRVRVLWPWKLVIGDDSWVGEGAWLLNLEPITIGSNVCLSQEVFLCTGSHRHASETFEFDNAPIAVNDGAWVASQAIILRGATIGHGALVGARAIVAHDVPAGFTVKAGDRH